MYVLSVCGELMTLMIRSHPRGAARPLRQARLEPSCRFPDKVRCLLRI